MNRFSNRTALVTGGGSGIGRAIALAFAAEGARVVVAGRTAETLAETVALAEKAGGQAAAVTSDVTDAEQATELVREAVARFGSLDIAVNNAGVAGAGRILDLTEDAWQQVLNVNLTGVFHCLRAEIGWMREHGGGAIVNIASTLGRHHTVPGLGAYGASKAALGALTRAAALEHIRDGVRINAVSPGPIDTPSSRRPGEDDAARDERIANTLPLGRVGSLEEVASGVLWLASPAAGFAVGHDLVLDGGSTA